ncbi:MAG: cation diffusion facilitator family transporter [Chitinivibrionales bacterium]|nr:cation diffusion facilitator family transporter [Chitinivibrionales bacterium]
MIWSEIFLNGLPTRTMNPCSWVVPCQNAPPYLPESAVAPNPRPDSDVVKATEMANKPLNSSVHKDFVGRQKRAQRVVNVGLAGNAILAAAKVVTGILGHSQALLADGVNSVSDAVYFVVVKLFVRLSGKPADKEHPYGHYQYETIAALVVGAFVLTTGIAIFWDSVNAAYDLFAGRTGDMPVRGISLIVAVATILIKVMLMIHAKNVGTATNNLAVNALARDHRNDIFASLGAAVGIGLGMVGLRWADPVAGALVAGVVVNTGFGILRDASDDLMDSVPSNQLAEQISRALADINGLEKVEEVHAHRFGPYLVANITIGVKGTLSVIEGDRIATDVENTLTRDIDMLRKVYVHYHPSNESNRQS